MILPWVLGNVEPLADALAAGFDTRTEALFELIVGNVAPTGRLPWGEQHAGVLKNFAANILDGTPLIAPGSDGIIGVRLPNAIHLSSWAGKEVPLDFEEGEYLAQLNQRIREEGKFPERS